MPETTPGAASAPEAETERDWSKLYGERYYLTDYTVPYGRNEHWLQFFGHVADRIAKDLAPISALDAGCAMGLLVEQLVHRGIDAYGIDLSEFAISNAPEEVRDRLSVGSITKPLPRRYDLITCIEVIEHLPAEEGRVALEQLCAATDRILFSSVPDGYDEPTHVNVQPPEDWSAWFAENGFFRAVDYDASYLAPWAVLYERRHATTADVVRSYDRALARLRNEVQQLRGAVLRLSEQLEAETAASASYRPRDADDRVRALEAEILRLRDELIGLDAEAGKARGEREYFAAQLAGQEQLALELQSVLTSRSWRLSRKLIAPASRLRQFLRR